VGEKVTKEMWDEALKMMVSLSNEREVRQN
jgi:hypothetical protein